MGWTTAGQGGAIMQLERVEDVLTQPQQMPRQWVALPDNAPQNVLAPTPHHRRRGTQPSQKVQKSKANSGIEVDCTTGPLPKFQRAESGSRFSFQVQTPKQPSFIGTQPLDKYEQGQTIHWPYQIAEAAAPRVQGWAVASQATGVYI
ncbi:hypothetical protein PISMIDRAFT_101608 [Pisolithus microcarpus 441]|uniref:Uncharacterized protein n=1 Tax=Pisolithus microcarpus 441 TaxID=765257 RepID=A0A0C9Z1K6_9AGAM|nr:hypothetical protein BKA83DRAFT_101608 [Pisolithus microcarpus]KIK22916.1 hypothetical protein PISMIDRAFT_101608 [Pisolithus microcarpus 441]